jgi:hypothetical protein
LFSRYQIKFTAAKLAANTIKADSGVIAEAAITNAMIDSINANKITAAGTKYFASEAAKNRSIELLRTQSVDFAIGQNYKFRMYALSEHASLTIIFIQ